MGHLTKITSYYPTSNGYYLSHHCVIKESSETTKLRVVFDESASSITGVSLNDILHTGPKLQEDLFDILLRFRSHQYVFIGDIEKMYRQFIARPEDRKYQRILWRADKAPYLANRCLKQLAKDEGHRFPRVAQVLQRNFYVNDALTGADTKAFVAIHVAEIQTKTDITDWRHVPTTDNPANLISRGQSPKEFLRATIGKCGRE
jgi:hypothetical protein